jgi:glycosyltransferase involved in cell wall biosynthesis
MQPLVAIVIACYNGAKFIEETIASAERQSYANTEIVVVDDGSTDNSRTILESRSRIRLVCQPNRGVANARNVGAAKSRGDYLLFLDQDDRLLPVAVESGVEAFSLKPEYGFVFGRKYVVRNGRRIQEDPVRESESGFMQQLSGDSLVPPSLALIRRDAFERVGGFEQRLAPADDYDFYLKLSRIHPLYCHNNLIVEYRRHSDNVSGRNVAFLLEKTLEALEQHKRYTLGDEALRRAHRSGRRHFQKLFGRYLAMQIVRRFFARRQKEAWSASLVLLRNMPMSGIGTVLGLIDVLRGQIE